MRHVAALLAVNGDEAALIDRDARGLGAQRAPIGHAAHSHQHVIVALRAGALCALEADQQAIGLRRDRRDFGAQHDLLIARLESLLEGLDEISVAAGNELRRKLDDADLGAQRFVDRGHFETDDAAADHQQPPGVFGEFEGTGRIEHARIARHERQHNRLGTGSDDALFKTQALALAVLRHFDDMRAQEFADTAQHFDLALPGKPGKPASELAHDLVLPGAQLAHVDLRRPECHAMRAHRPRFVDHLGGMQQRLRWDAADVEADSAERRPAINQCYLEPEIGSPEGRGIAAGSGAEHQQLHIAIGSRLRGGGRRRRGT